MPEQSENTTENTVGYKMPPKKSQWKPGQSGNPNGRPKKVKDFEKLLDNELDKAIRINDGGEICLISKREIIVKSLVNDAIKGDARARKLIFPLLMNRKTVEGFEPDAADREAFAEIMDSVQINKSNTEIEVTNER